MAKWGLCSLGSGCRQTAVNAWRSRIGISQGSLLPRLPSCACSTQILGYEPSLPVAGHLKTLYLSRWGHRVASVVSAALAVPGWSELPVVGIEVLGHLLLEDLLEDGLRAFPDSGLHVPLHVMIEAPLRGKVPTPSLETHKLPDAIPRGVRASPGRSSGGRLWLREAVASSLRNQPFFCLTRKIAVFRIIF